jgi:prepilin-type N-terminal cleavage/methylation domain-containing protein
MPSQRTGARPGFDLDCPDGPPLKTKTMKRAFTLIELLVVIAIIAILAAILFPVFAQAKLAAKKIAGLSQVKQIGTAVHIYLSDYDDVLMPYRHGSSSGPTINTNYMKWQAAGDPRAATWDTQGATTKKTIFFSDMLQPYIKNDQIWNAPGHSNAWSVFQDKGTWDVNFHSYGGQNSYAANQYLLLSNQGAPAGAIAEVSDTLLFVDATYYNALPAQPLAGFCQLTTPQILPVTTYSHYWKHLGNNMHNFNSPGNPNPDDPSNAQVLKNIDNRYSGVLNVVRADSSGKAMNAKALVYDLRQKLDRSIWNPGKVPCQ